jgi:hypothetical protein
MTRNPAYYGSWVADVTVIRGCGAEIRIYLAVQVSTTHAHCTIWRAVLVLCKLSASFACAQSVSRQLQIARARMELFPADDSLTARHHFKAKAELEELSKKLMVSEMVWTWCSRGSRNGNTLCQVLLSKLRKLDYLTGDNRHSSISYVPSAGEAHKASVVHGRASLSSTSVSANSTTEADNPTVATVDDHRRKQWRNAQHSSTRSVDSTSTAGTSDHTPHTAGRNRTTSRAGPSSSRKDVQLSLKSFSTSESQLEADTETEFASTLPPPPDDADSESDDCDEYNIYGNSPPSIDDVSVRLGLVDVASNRWFWHCPWRFLSDRRR